MKVSNLASEMIRISINALKNREENSVSNLYKMENSLDALYSENT